MIVGALVRIGTHEYLKGYIGRLEFKTEKTALVIVNGRRQYMHVDCLCEDFKFEVGDILIHAITGQPKQYTGTENTNEYHNLGHGTNITIPDRLLISMYKNCNQREADILLSLFPTQLKEKVDHAKTDSV